MITQQILSKETAGAEVADNSAVAVTGAGASVAAIPGWGWAAAIGVAAATFAAMSQYSAEGGFDVPAGVSPVTQLHPEEMVLPAPIANTFRGVAAGAGGGSGLPSRAPNVTIKVDGQMGDFFIMHRDKLADAINALVRERHIGAGRAF